MPAVATEPKTSQALPARDWVSLSTLSMMGCGSIAALQADAFKNEERAGAPEDGCRKIIVDDETGDVQAIWSEDLGVILSAARARTAKAYKPEWGELLATDAAMLGFCLGSVVEIAARDILGLAARRGVLVRDGEVDRIALFKLGQLLEAERNISPEETDWAPIPGMKLEGQLYEMVATRAPSHLLESWDPVPPVPVPYVPPYFPEPDRGDTRRIATEFYDDGPRITNICAAMGIRTQPDKAVGRGGRTQALRFDLRRRLGIADGPAWSSPLPFRTIEGHAKMQARAYNTVFGIK